MGCAGRTTEREVTARFNDTQSVFKVGVQKSIPTQIRQFIFNISNNKGHVDGFVWELTPAHRL